MREKIIIILCFFSVFKTEAQQPYDKLIDSICNRAKTISLYRDSVNWDTMKHVMKMKSKNATKIEELKPAFDYLLNQLRDHHGRILLRKDYSTLSYFTDYKNKRFKDKREFNIEAWKVVNDVNLSYSYKLLKNGIAYLKIVGIGPMVDIEKESIKIRNSINKMYKNRVIKWIVDLRYNGGGNMHPMMAGLGPLIGDGKVGMTMDSKGYRLFDWEIKNGNFIYDSLQVVYLRNKITFDSLPKVVVLTSRWTVSSGEIVATAFKGRPNTFFIGEATGGATTETNFEIFGEVILNISTGYFSDRNGVVYDENIPVDFEIPFEIVAGLYKDKCINAAINWLEK